MRPPNSTTPMTPDEIAKLRHDFEELASQLTRVWTETEKPIKADFPKGIIRTIASCHKRYPYISSSRRRTLACVLQLCDINRWNLNMWRIGLTAGTVWEWHCAIPVICVSETLTHEFAVQRSWMTADSNFKKGINVLNSKGVIKRPLHDQLHELREFRNTIHLHLQGKVAMHDGLPKRYNDSVRALQQLEAAMKTFWKAEA